MGATARGRLPAADTYLIATAFRAGMHDDPAWAAVFWDIGGVILAVDSVKRAHEAFVEDLCAAYPCAVAPSEALSTWRVTVGDYFAERDGTEFRPARVAYDRAVEAILDRPVPRDEWRGRFHEAFDRHAEPNAGAVETIGRLAEMPVHVGVISDVDHEEGQRILRGFGIWDHVDSYTSSESVGRTKPDSRMFEAALDAAGVPAARSLMVGDRYTHDMAGAKAVGLSSIAYGAEDGPAVDFRVSSLEAVLDVVADASPDASE